ncbi:PLDc N-terminal domain-containing protein [Trujillonella humicola]|uniref:PLDc N-terminal domain-containing protein n=1 Tax=Trujillonella humicola TaxID=3383699 RepID=UPI003905A5D5
MSRGRHHRTRWGDLPRGRRRALLVLAALQLALAVAAWTDLATRPAEQVQGPKARWAAVIAVNWVGPLAWFRWGRRAHPPHA